MKIENIQLLCDILMYTSIFLSLLLLLPDRSNEKDRRIPAVLLLAICIAGYLWTAVRYPVEGYIFHKIFWLFIPATLAAWKSSRYRDSRFWFTVCSAFVFGVNVYIISSGIAVSVGGDAYFGICLQIFLSIAFLLYLYKIHPKYRSVLEKVTDGWKVLSGVAAWHCIVLMMLWLYIRKIRQIENWLLIAFAFCITAVITYLLIGRSLMLAVKNTTAGMWIERMKEYENLVFVDELTGLLNRRALDQEMEKLEREKTPFFYVMFDLNDLKQVNDEYGHFQGDVFIKKAAVVLKECGKDAIGAYRTGGDEFVLLFPDCGNGNMEEKLKVIQEKCDAFYKYNNKSFGMALGYGKIEDYEQDSIDNMLIRSDRDMYSNKIKMKSGNTGK